MKILNYYLSSYKFLFEFKLKGHKNKETQNLEGQKVVIAQLTKW